VKSSDTQQRERTNTRKNAKKEGVACETHDLVVMQVLGAAYAFGTRTHAELAILPVCVSVYLSVCLSACLPVHLSATLRYRHNQSRCSPRHCLSLYLPFSLLSSCSKVLLESCCVCMCFCLQLDMSRPVGAYVADQLARWGFTAEMESFVSRLEAACWPVTHKLANLKLTSCTSTWRQNISQLGQVILSVCYWLNSTAVNSCDRNLHLYFCPCDCATTSGYMTSSIECKRYCPH